MVEAAVAAEVVENDVDSPPKQVVIFSFFTRHIWISKHIPVEDGVTSTRRLRIQKSKTRRTILFDRKIAWVTGPKGIFRPRIGLGSCFN